MENEGRGAENRSRRRLTRGKWNALAVLALGLTILGADKSPATRALQRFLSRSRTIRRRPRRGEAPMVRNNQGKS